MYFFNAIHGSEVQDCKASLSLLYFFCDSTLIYLALTVPSCSRMLVNVFSVERQTQQVDPAGSSLAQQCRAQQELSQRAKSSFHLFWCWTGWAEGPGWGKLQWTPFPVHSFTLSTVVI